MTKGQTLYEGAKGNKWGLQKRRAFTEQWFSLRFQELWDACDIKMELPKPQVMRLYSQRCILRKIPQGPPFVFKGTSA